MLSAVSSRTLDSLQLRHYSEIATSYGIYDSQMAQTATLSEHTACVDDLVKLAFIAESLPTKQIDTLL